MRTSLRPLWVAFLLLATCVLSWATETENLGIRALPTPGKMTIDGHFADWDLSGGIYACGDAESQRDQFGAWFHLMYDADNLYLLTRWVDETPLNHWGSTRGDYGFAGDCLQFRIITNFQQGKERLSHWTCWRDRDGLDVVDSAYGKGFNEPGALKDAQTAGAVQEFSINADGKGYAQEIALPWTLLTKEEQVLKAGNSLVITLEPNFTVGQAGRMSIKDIFRPGIALDRVFTFMSYPCWGVATLIPTGKVAPQPERLADGREFPVTMEKGQPRIDWTGLIKQHELPGFKPIVFTMPEDGYISLNITDEQGTVVRHLLNCAFFTRGKHTVSWDGLTTPFARKPGKPVQAGNYRWEAIWHKGLGLRLRGFANNGGNAPWDADATSNWGGDHGNPIECATDGKKVYLGWTGAEAGKALVACNLNGDVQWKHTRGGIGAAQRITVDNGQVFVQSYGELYRVDAQRGSYTEWQGTGSASLSLAAIMPAAKELNGLTSKDGKLYVSFTKRNAIAVVNATTGKVEKTLEVPAPARLLYAGGRLLAVSGSNVVAVHPESGAVTKILTGLTAPTGLAVDGKGQLYVACNDADSQVKRFTADGTPAGAFGRKGGRPALGQWVADGMRHLQGITVDAEGKLWVAEGLETPKRFCVWDTTTGKLLKEFFGPSHYGASGGTINPLDPNIMVGGGCEWRIDPKTGRGICTGVFEERSAGFARFCRGTNGKLYLVNGDAFHEAPNYRIFERVAEGDYRLRAKILNTGTANTTRFWADANGDAQEQPEEVTLLPGGLNASGYCAWSHFAHTDLTFYGNLKESTRTRAVRIPVAGFTACNAPLYALEKVENIPGAGLPSLDEQYLCVWKENAIVGYRRADGKELWSYPNTFSGVHGSHLATGPEVGLLRGAFGVVGSATLPATGALWALNGNCGEWYLFSEKGFFVSQLFQGDQMRIKFPEKALPGAILDTLPCGMGGEDFGGSLTQGVDGKLYLQSGKTGLWNVEVVGTESIKAMRGKTIAFSDGDVKLAQTQREEQLQAVAGTKRLTAKKLTPTFTGNLEADFKGDLVTYDKQAVTRVRTALAWDDTTLYAGWEVQDDTPWVNGADAPEFLYARGDTVDLQLGTDPKAAKGRIEPAKGDLRLSIGNFQGKPVVVLYRPVADAKSPRIFSSGVVKEYKIDSVLILEAARVEVKIEKNRRYVVEAALPLAALGVTPADGLTLRGDVGVTHGDKTGTDTALRTWWNNQQTGLVNDEVFELKLEPKNWGELGFKQ
jgi:hypothetical protein